MHLERRQRVFDRRDDCRRRRYRPALAGALDAERIEGLTISTWTMVHIGTSVANGSR